MNTLRSPFHKFGFFLSLISAGLSALLLVKNKAPRGFLLWFPKLLGGALAPFSALLGVTGAFLGVLSRSHLAVLLGGFGALVSARYLKKVTAEHTQFDSTFGPGWESKISHPQRRGMLQKRWSWRMPPAARPIFEQDIAFWTLPGDPPRELLCDLWRPPAGAKPSGLALIYFHGSAWYMLDKDYGTRLFFRHLAAQGHTIMDVAYRLAPETDMQGMLGDVKRAIAWMKANAARYQVNPARIVLGGASAGGHLSLLAAYTPQVSALNPQDMNEADLSVRAVISAYGPSDLIACYYHTNQQHTTRAAASKPAQVGGDDAMVRRMEALMGKNYRRLGFDKSLDAGSFFNLLGAHPDQQPEIYHRFSPIQYVHPDCPPTLLIQGEDDLITPAQATRLLHKKLKDCGVPAINIIFPQTDHGFDLMLPELSPSAQSALYEIDRFLALMV